MAKAEEKPTIEKLVKQIEIYITKMFTDGAGMMEIRKEIHRIANFDGNNMLSTDERKEYAKLLKDRFERLKLFAESSYSEIVQVTSQVGW